MIRTRPLVATLGLATALVWGAVAPADAGPSKVVDVKLVSVHVASDGDAIGCGDFDPQGFWVDDPGTAKLDRKGSWKPAATKNGYWDSLCSGSTYALPANDSLTVNQIRLPISANTVTARVRAVERDGLTHCTADDLLTVAAPAPGSSKVAELEVSDGCGAAKGIDLRFTVQVTRIS